MGVPIHLASGHFSRVAGYVLEGYVPAADGKRLLQARPPQSLTACWRSSLRRAVAASSAARCWAWDRQPGGTTDHGHNLDHEDLGRMAVLEIDGPAR
ncbi:DUF411 domain-containing protein [Synechococcus sp. BA-132 BA5]|uniref:DUF411 domain-containing protein n=1 Tax=Synechococcus sp. BA-132 BA5 TaxID=3110252 RepID=UPI003FCE8EA6